MTMPRVNQDQDEELVEAFRKQLRIANPYQRRSLLTRLTRSYGPEFASRLVQPELLEQEVAVPEPLAAEQRIEAERLEPGTPWYAKPVKWAYENVPMAKELMEGYQVLQEEAIDPVAMSVASWMQPELRKELEQEYAKIPGFKTAWSIPTETREKIWEEADVPWLMRHGLEALYDPFMWYPGWGLSTKAMKGLEKAGMGPAAKLLKPASLLEEGFMKAAAKPVELLGKGLRKIPEIKVGVIAGKPRKIGALFQESPRSMVANEARHTFDALQNLARAGDITGRRFSQILEDFKLGMLDPTLAKTITNPNQKAVIERLLKNANKLDLDIIAKVADKYPDRAALVLGAKEMGLLAKELGVEAKRRAKGALGYVQDIYSLWKRSVLYTPWYVQQNLVENPLRLLLQGTDPFTGFPEIARLASLTTHPIDIQRRAISLSDRMNRKVPEAMASAGVSPITRTAATGGVTEAMIGSLATGKRMAPLTIAAWADDMAILRCYWNMYEQYTRTLLAKASPEAADALARGVKLYDDAKLTGIVEPALLDHLKSLFNTGSVDDVIEEFAKIQRNKTMTIARTINSAEQALPDAIKGRIREELPRLWARNDFKGIERMFKSLRKTMPDRIVDYQKRLMIQQLKEFRNLEKLGVPARLRPLLTKIINSFKYDKVVERESRLASAESLSEFQRAMFAASTESRRELERLTEGRLIAEVIAGRADTDVLVNWYGISEAVHARAFKEGEALVDNVFGLSRIIQHAKDPAKIQARWDEFVMSIQSEFPESAAILTATTPDADVLWTAYREIQEKRWFNVGQEQLAAMGIDLKMFPKAVGADGKLVTQEAWLGTQLKTLKSWEDRVVEAWSKRHETPTSRNQMLDGLRDESIRLKESMGLQQLKAQREAMDLAMTTTYETFGNYGVRTNLDDIMQGLGAPFWFFPSRSVPFYTKQMFMKPRLGADVISMQQEAHESDKPLRIFGSVNIPGTNFYWNPIRSSMLWQLMGEYDWSPRHLGELEHRQLQVQQKVGVSLGPQWSIAANLVSRLMKKKSGEGFVTGEPMYVIPHHRWLEAVEGLDLPGISQIAGIITEPFDAYLRAVFGTEVANWQQREVEKYIVDMGYNPQDLPNLPKEVIQKGWKRFWTRQLLSIPGGVVKEWTQTEQDYFEAIGTKADELGLTKGQRAQLRATGESPFTGLRQDQLEALYKDVPAQKLMRYIRPVGLTQATSPYWEDYIQLRIEREVLRGDPEDPQKNSRLWREQKLDKALKSGRISPREWKALYRQSYQEYISGVKGLEMAHPLAMKTEEDWEAFRDMIGWDTPVRHPDDIILDDYYDTMDSANFEDPDVPGEFNYDAYRQAEQEFFSGLSESTLEYIGSRKSRYKTPLRATYTEEMKKVQSYYELEKLILSQFPPGIAALIEQASRVPDPAIQRELLRSNPLASIALRKIRRAKQMFRRSNPEVDRILRFWSS